MLYIAGALPPFCRRPLRRSDRCSRRAENFSLLRARETRGMRSSGCPGCCHLPSSRRPSGKGLRFCRSRTFRRPQVARRGIGAPCSAAPRMREAGMTEISGWEGPAFHCCMDLSMSVSSSLPPSTLSSHESEKFRDDYPRKCQSPFSPQPLLRTTARSQVLSFR